MISFTFSRTAMMSFVGLSVSDVGEMTTFNLACLGNLFSPIVLSEISCSYLEAFISLTKAITFAKSFEGLSISNFGTLTAFSVACPMLS